MKKASEIAMFGEMGDLKGSFKNRACRSTMGSTCASNTLGVGRTRVGQVYDTAVLRRL